MFFLWGLKIMLSSLVLRRSSSLTSEHGLLARAWCDVMNFASNWVRGNRAGTRLSVISLPTHPPLTCLHCDSRRVRRILPNLDAMRWLLQCLIRDRGAYFCLGGLKLMSAGGLGACFLEGFGDMLPREILTSMSSKMAKNASKYVRCNTWRHF